MKKLIYLSLILLTSQVSKAQYNIGLAYTGMFSNDVAHFLPSENGLDIRKISIRLSAFHGAAGNSVVSANRAYSYGKYFEKVEIDDYKDGIETVSAILPSLLDNLGKRGILASSGYAQIPFGLVYKIKKSDKSELATFSLNYRMIAGGSFTFGGTIPQIIWSGNSEFVGEETNLGPFEIQSHIYSETSLGFALPLLELSSGTKLRMGVNVKYLTGFGALYTRTGDIMMNTDANGRYIDFGVNYDVNLAGIYGFAYAEASDTTNTFTYNNSDIRNATGHGLGLDIGVTADIASNLRVTASMIDIGGVRYDDYVYNFKIDRTYRWDGLPMNFFDIDSLPFDADTLFNNTYITESEETFVVPLAQRLVLHARYGIGENETSKGMVYFKHNFYGTYIQGFNNLTANSTRAFINLGYTYNMKNILTIGANAGIGGISRYNLGLFGTVKAGPFRMGIGSNSLFGLIVPSVMRGADVSFNMALAW